MAALFRQVPIAAIAMAIAAISASAFAGTPPLQIDSHFTVERRVARADGSVQLVEVPATRAVPGDLVNVVVEYRNNGTSPLANLAVSNPVPHGLVFKSVGTSGLEVSIDGARFAPPAQLVVTSANGTSHAARADEIKAVRFTLTRPLPPHQAGRFAFKAIVQ